VRSDQGISDWGTRKPDCLTPDFLIIDMIAGLPETDLACCSEAGRPAARFLMAVVDLIQKKVELLPEPTQQEVLDFVDYLLQRVRQEDVLWSKISLGWALRGLEDEEWPEYDTQALEEKWA
jgi:hypothetical protein